MRAKLIGIPGSHPSLAAELMLRHKGIPYSRFDLPNMSHRFILPLLRYRSTTVPVMRLDGRRVTTTRRIARALDALQPDPPLLPAENRAAVEAAEAWADDELQDGVRQLGRWAAVHDPQAMATFLDGVHMGVPEGAVRLAMCFDQLRERIAARPAGAHARRLCPDYPGCFGAVVPEAWISRT